MTAVSRDYGEIATEYDQLPDGMPVIVIRADDSLAPIALKALNSRASEMGKEDLARYIESLRGEVEMYQAEHSGEVNAGKSFPKAEEEGSAEGVDDEATYFHE